MPLTVGRIRVRVVGHEGLPRAERGLDAGRVHLLSAADDRPEARRTVGGRVPRAVARHRVPRLPGAGNDGSAAHLRHVHEPTLVGGAAVTGVVVDVELEVRGTTGGAGRDLVGRVAELVEGRESDARVAPRLDGLTAGRVDRQQRAPRPAGGVPGPLTYMPLPFVNPSPVNDQLLGAAGVETTLSHAAATSAMPASNTSVFHFRFNAPPRIGCASKESGLLGLVRNINDRAVPLPHSWPSLRRPDASCLLWRAMPRHFAREKESIRSDIVPALARGPS